MKEGRKERGGKGEGGGRKEEGGERREEGGGRREEGRELGVLMLAFVGHCTAFPVCLKANVRSMICMV